MSTDHTSAPEQHSIIERLDPASVVFVGSRLEEPVGATVHMLIHGNEVPLPLHLEMRNHSPNGFEWGYAGSAPSQLGLAMCAELVDRDSAIRAYQTVKARLIATIPQDTKHWTISGTALRQEIERALRPS